MTDLESEDRIRGYIYKIVSDKTEKVYIGATTNKLGIRFSCHKYGYRKYQEGKHFFISSFEVIKYGDARIELVEEVIVNRRKDLRKREREIVRSTENAVNVLSPYVSKQERKLMKKLYNEKNREKMNEKAREKKRCKICNCEVNRCVFARHEKSLTHIANLKKEK